MIFIFIIMTSIVIIIKISIKLQKIDAQDTFNSNNLCLWPRKVQSVVCEHKILSLEAKTNSLLSLSKTGNEINIM